MKKTTEGSFKVTPEFAHALADEFFCFISHRLNEDVYVSQTEHHFNIECLSAPKHEPQPKGQAKLL